MTTGEITRKYLEGKRLNEFAEGLGVTGITRQHVHSWKSDKQRPDAIFLVSVLGSKQAAPWAHAWAGECLAVQVQERATKNLWAPDAT